MAQSQGNIEDAYFQSTTNDTMWGFTTTIQVAPLNFGWTQALGCIVFWWPNPPVLVGGKWLMNSTSEGYPQRMSLSFVNLGSGGQMLGEE